MAETLGSLVDKLTVCNVRIWHLIDKHRDKSLSDKERLEAADAAWQRGEASDVDLRKVSVARCARVSYLTHELKKPAPEADLKLYAQLVGGWPIHASPAEHQATPDEYEDGPRRDGLVVADDGSRWRSVYGWRRPELHGNFVGWVQYRKTMAGEDGRDKVRW